MTTIVAVGIDLAKNVFAVHGIDEHGKATLVRAQVRRDQLLELVASLPPYARGSALPLTFTLERSPR